MGLCLAISLLNFSNAQTLIPGQEYTTGNIVVPTTTTSGSTWVNGVYQNSLTCWSWGDPGYCGPNAIVRPGNNINFSFGTTDLYQIQSIANVLPNSGSGLRVNGYNFGFTAKNGNGWDDGRVDYLTAYVNLYDKNNQIAYNKVYDLNYKFNWTTFNFTETFTNPYAVNDLTNVQYGFVGRDNNSWAGPYGPEVNNISFSLKYSVDPCSVSVLSSPTCPGYLETINSYNTLPAVQEPVQQAQIQPVEQPSQTATVVSTPIVQQVVTSSPIATTNTASTSQQSRTNAPSTNRILSILNSVQSQVAAVERSAVQTAQQEAQKLATQAQEQADSFGSQQQAQEQNSAQQQNFQSTNTQQKVLNINTNTFSVLQSNNNQTNNTAFSSQTISNDFGFQQKFQENQALQTNQAVSPVYQLIAPQQLQQQEIVQPITVVNIPKEHPITTISVEQKEVIGPTNLLQEFVENKFLTDNVNQSPTTKQVNQKAQDSELAVGVSIAVMAKQPQGFDSYTLVLQDVPFYPSTEVYKNQRTVDNQRVMRALTGASDQRHKDLVDLQYRR